MKPLSYKIFAYKFYHKKPIKNSPHRCHFELTFKCSLHCRHCYTDCYNQPDYINKELKTAEVKFILDKLYKANVLWLCFSGGDPLARRDFLDIYSYAKSKGFLITLFTSGYSVTQEIVRFLKKSPPFMIEITLNAVTKELYERISQVVGSFDKSIQGIKLIEQAHLPLKIKTQVTKDNLKELPKIKKFIAQMNLKYQPVFQWILRGQLNGNPYPYDLRISPSEYLAFSYPEYLSEDDCQFYRNLSSRTLSNKLFSCELEIRDRVQIDPYGNIFLCNFIRKPNFSLLKEGVQSAQEKLLSLIRNRKFSRVSKCGNCNLRKLCHWCPGKAYLEKGNFDSSIDYYCQLAKATRQLLNNKLKNYGCRV
jgi:radical SAM protein with 4Fe4S-binding SPASM domain